MGKIQIILIGNFISKGSDMLHFLMLSFGLVHIGLANPLTLDEIYQASKLNMESIKKAEGQIRQSTEKKKQAIGALLPSVRFVATETRIDAPSAGMINRAFVLNRQYSTAFRLEQPLLRGGSLAALELTEEEILLNKFFKNFQHLNLYQVVLRNYFDLVRATHDLQLLNELLFLSEKREKELKYLTKLGRSRKSELIQAEAQSLGVKAKIYEAGIFLNQSRENLKYLSGLEVNEILPVGHFNEEIPNSAQFESLISKRPDVLMKDQEIAMAQKQVTIAKGGHYPSVDFFSNYYVDRTGILQTSDWDFGVSISLPLFQGGSVQASVRESLERKREAELSQLELKRSLKRDLSILYKNYLQLREQLKTLQLTVTKTKEAYELNLRDYELGQITNLEVLQSMNLYIENKRTYQSLLVEAHAQWKNLEAFSGDIP
jgi:outer membrane protein